MTHALDAISLDTEQGLRMYGAVLKVRSRAMYEEVVGRQYSMVGPRLSVIGRRSSVDHQSIRTGTLKKLSYSRALMYPGAVFSLKS